MTAKSNPTAEHVFDADSMRGVSLTIGSPPRDRPLWIWLCLLGAVGVALSLWTDARALRIGLLIAMALVAVSTILIATRRRKPESPQMWYVFAAGGSFLVAATTMGSVRWANDTHDAITTFVSFQLVGFGLVFCGFLIAARLRKTPRDLDSILDAMILGLAFGLFAWRSVFNDAVSGAEVGTFEAFTVSLLPALDIVTGAALLRRAFAAVRTSTPYRLVMGAAACATGAHIVSGVSVLRMASVDAHIPFQIGLLTFLAAAAAHPEMAKVTRADRASAHKFGATRIALLALALLDPPVVMLMDYKHPERSSAPLLFGAVGMSVIVIIRLITLAREMEKTRQRERIREQRFESLVRNSTDLIVLLDTSYRMTYLSPAVKDILGFRPAEVLGRLATDAFHPDDLEHTSQALFGLDAGATSELNLVRLRHRGGGWRWMEARAVNLVDDPTVEGIVINCRDVTERIAAEGLLFDTNAQQSAVARLGREALTAPGESALIERAIQLIRMTLEAKSATMLLFEEGRITDIVVARASATVHEPLIDVPDPRIMAACAAATEPIQFVDPDPAGDLRATEDLIFRQFPDTRISPGVDDAVDDTHSVMAMQVVDQERVTGTLLVRTNGPRQFTRSEAGFLSTMAGTLGLAIARRRTEASAKHSALHDELTGLPNRSLFVDRLEHALAQRQRRGNHLAVLFLDIDHFKVINDSLGHSAGDRILTEVARRLDALVRPSDTVARFGGDEFTILLTPLDDSEEAAAIAERIRGDVSRPIPIGITNMQPTISIGVALASVSGSDAEGLLRDADAAMYQAKEMGRNKVAFFDDTMRDRVIHRLRTEIDLPRAIATGQLVLHYQPIFDLATGRVEGVEALVRWEHPRLGLIQPGQFIPVAEQSGLIGDIDLWVMHQVMEQCADHYARLGDASPWFGFNISARTVASPELPFLIAQALTEMHAPAEKVCLEITESALMNDIDHSIGTLQALRDQGISLAIDDFGTGYSSLTYLKQLPITDLKIDASFVAGLDSGERDRAIVETIVRLASTLGHSTIAEGVETRAQLDSLREIRCPKAQGFLLGRPAPIETVMARDQTIELQPLATRSNTPHPERPTADR